MSLLAGLLLARVWTWPVQLDWVLGDLGFLLTPGMWVRDGVLPYRDFLYVYGPYKPLLDAGVMTLLGEQESSLRAAVAVALALTAAGTYAYGRRVLPRRSAACAAALCWVLLSATLNSTYANAFCVPLSIWALHLAFGHPTMLRAALIGVLAGVAMALKINAGGLILVTAALVMLRPRADAPLPRRAVWADPLWPPLVLLPVVAMLLVRQRLATLTMWAFPAVALTGVSLLAYNVLSPTSPPVPRGDRGSLARRWALALSFAGGVVAAQTGWVLFYWGRVSPSTLWSGLVLVPLALGTGVTAAPHPPLVQTGILLVCFGLSGLSTRQQRVRMVSAWALPPLVVWYCVSAVHDLPVSRAGLSSLGEWLNLLELLPVVGLCVVVRGGVRRAGASATARRWHEGLAVALATQYLLCFPFAQALHFSYLAPFSALALIQFVRAGWGPISAPVSVPRLLWLRAAVPILVVAIVVEQRTAVWVQAWRQEGRWPGAVQLAPPRADIWAPPQQVAALRSVYDTVRSHPALRKGKFLAFPSPYFHWLTGTRSPLYNAYPCLPGFASPTEVAAEAYRVRAARPELVVLRMSENDIFFNPAIMVVTSPDILRVLEQDYRTWLTVPPYYLLLRRDAPPASGA